MYTTLDVFGGFLLFGRRSFRLYSAFSTESYWIPSALLLFQCFQWRGVPRKFKTASKYWAIRSSPTTESFTDPAHKATTFYIIEQVSAHCFHLRLVNPYNNHIIDCRIKNMNHTIRKNDKWGKWNDLQAQALNLSLYPGYLEQVHLECPGHIR